jgi:hypothetical protein
MISSALPFLFISRVRYNLEQIIHYRCNYEYKAPLNVVLLSRVLKTTYFEHISNVQKNISKIRSIYPSSRQSTKISKHFSNIPQIKNIQPTIM